MFDLYMETVDKQTHVAVIGQKSHRLEDIFLDYPRGYAFHTPKWAAIYYGRITQVDTRLNVAFVDLGNGKQGMLPAKHIYKPDGGSSDISFLVGTGEWLFVQVKAEGHDTEDEAFKKLARLTTKIHIPGRTLLYSPNVLGISSSHWINEAQEQHIGHILNTRHPKGGWVIRQMAADIDREVLLCEADSLVAEWEEAKEKAKKAHETGNPARIWDAPDAIERAFIDYARRGLGHIETMTQKHLEQAKAWAVKFAPDLVPRITLAKFSPQDRVKSLFEAHDIHSALQELHEKTVPLPSGGNIVIERTEACVVVDVNAVYADAFQTNMEAAEEIMRQIRVRNFSGIIICDMIGMASKTQRHQLVDAFELHGRFDPADPQIHGLTRLMLMEITRRRRSASLRDKRSIITDEFPGNK